MQKSNEDNMVTATHGAPDTPAYWQDGLVQIGEMNIPRVTSRIIWRDILGSWRARWGLWRMHYLIPAGLYALGRPDSQSPVMVSANYKMSFDVLRRNLAGISAWLLVLDTKGINVWCAAGKGTFGTAELIHRIEAVRLGEVVSQRNLILPQLAAPGVTAREVAAQTGFKPIFGPIQAKDIPAFLNAGMQATPQMRRIQFPLLDRLVLTPIEIIGSVKYLAVLIVALFFLTLISPGPLNFYRILWETGHKALPFLGAALIGTVIVPLLLPWIPGRSFAWKGCLLGFLWCLALIAGGYFGQPATGWLEMLGMTALAPALSAWLAFNFTGCTPFTSLSGVDKEMRTILPLLIGAAAVGILMLIIQKILLFF